MIIGPELAAVLGIGAEATRTEAAGALARIAGLPEPVGDGARRVLSEIVQAVQHKVIDFPDVPMDRAVVADTAIALGAMAAGEAALQETFVELGGESLDWYVRGALHERVAPALARRGVLRLIGG